MTRVGKDPDDLSTLVLVEWQEGHTAHQGNTDVGQSNEAPQEMVFIKSEAALRVVEDVGGYVLGTVAYVLRKIIPRPLRDFVYSYCVAPYRCVGRTCRAGVCVCACALFVCVCVFESVL
jgi:predicted DCC family thiol-disulfide oxidoreductase YuxK